GKVLSTLGKAAGPKLWPLGRSPHRAPTEGALEATGHSVGSAPGAGASPAPPPPEHAAKQPLGRPGAAPPRRIRPAPELSEIAQSGSAAPPLCFIGDLHGRADLLTGLFAEIRNRDPEDRAELIFLGDLIDR